MSRRAILEFDRSMAGNLGERFLLALVRALASDSEEDWERLRDFGVRRIGEPERALRAGERQDPVP